MLKGCQAPLVARTTYHFVRRPGLIRQARLDRQPLRLTAHPLEDDWPFALPLPDPVFDRLEPASPPQTIILSPVQTATWSQRLSGAFIKVVGVQVSSMGLYREPVSSRNKVSPSRKTPPQMIISFPVQTEVCN